MTADLGRDAAVAWYSRRHEALSSVQTGRLATDMEALGGATIMLRAWSAEIATMLGDPLPEPEGSCPCPACFRYITRNWVR